MERLLNDEVVEQVNEAFQELQEPVTVLFFEDDSCEYCSDTLQLVQEVTDLTDLIDLKEYHINENAEMAKKFKVDKAPGLVIASTDENGEILDYGIRFAGIPSGHEFTTLIQDLLIVSARNPELTPETMEYLDKLENPVLLQVFVTPTCPYCPQAVVLAHRLAFASDNIEAEMVETSEFMDLARKYQVSGVPDTSINHGAGKVVGAVPENNLIEEIQQALAS